MNKKTANIIVSQIESLIENYDIQISRVGLPQEYEITVFNGPREHSHYGGKTLAEALNRAIKKDE